MSASRDVLLVEDNPDDVLFMQQALTHGRGLIDLKVVGDGQAALAYLRGQGQYAGVGVPSMVLLDLKLPMKNGKEVLQEMRSDPALKTLPVLVLTSSDSESDVREAHALGANCYFSKPTGIEQLQVLITLIEDLWLIRARLPQTGVPRP